MFSHLFSYRFKCLLRNRTTVFWTLVFPLVLATLFHFAFGHLTSEAEAFRPIPVALVVNDISPQGLRLQEILRTLSQPGPDQFLDLRLADLQEGERLLEKDEVAGIISLNEHPQLIVRRSDLQQTILKSFLDAYLQTGQTIAQLLGRNPQLTGELADYLEKRPTFTEQISFSKAKPDTMLGFFFALIATTCLYGSFWGVLNTGQLQADQSPQGARRSAAPTPKMMILASDTLAALTIGFLEVLILLAYLKYPLGVSFGEELGLILLTSLAGCTAGVSLGYFIGTAVRRGENLKIGILLTVNMTLSFLAGLMWGEIKEIIARQVPFLAYLNPTALVADSLYSLYIFPTHRRFFVNIGCLFVLAVLFSLASFVHLRRERYASI